MNSPSYWLKKPSPMAAPKLAMAGNQAAEPIAETTLPSAPVLPAMRVMSPMCRSRVRLTDQRLRLDG